MPACVMPPAFFTRRGVRILELEFLSFHATLSRRSATAFALLIPICTLLSACAGSTPAAPLRADFTIAIEREADVPPGSLYFKPVPGGLLGKSVDDELLRSRPDAKMLKVNTLTLSARLQEHAEFVRSDDFNPGELATPRALGIARVGAFYEPALRDGCSDFRTSLNAGTRGSAMLVYVDRPGSVRGVRYTAPYVIDYRLDFPAAGIYVVALHTQGIVVTPRIVDAASGLRATVKASPCPSL